MPKSRRTIRWKPLTAKDKRLGRAFNQVRRRGITKRLMDSTWAWRRSPSLIRAFADNTLYERNTSATARKEHALAAFRKAYIARKHLRLANGIRKPLRNYPLKRKMRQPLRQYK